MKNYIKIAVLIVVLISFVTCNKIENETISSVCLVVTNVIGHDLGDEESAIHYSDVITQGSIINDVVGAEVYATFINPFYTTINPENLTYPSGMGPTLYQYITIDQIDISFTRSDGRNIEGVDVPYAFSQKVNFGISISDLSEGGDAVSSTISFTMIRHNAKIEPPLVGLVNIGEDKILKLEAHITFHAIDQAGFRLQPVTVTMSVYCANFADKEE